MNPPPRALYVGRVCEGGGGGHNCIGVEHAGPCRPLVPPDTSAQIAVKTARCTVHERPPLLWQMPTDKSCAVLSSCPPMILALPKSTSAGTLCRGTMLPGRRSLCTTSIPCGASIADAPSCGMVDRKGPMTGPFSGTYQNGSIPESGSLTVKRGVFVLSSSRPTTHNPVSDSANPHYVSDPLPPSFVGSL